MECLPITSVDQLLASSDCHPSWYELTDAFVPCTTVAIRNTTVDCDAESMKIDEKLLLGTKSPRTIICHDMMGGYKGDNCVAPLEITNGYSFTKWDQIDMFIYFSHHFVTVPPLYWINTAHKNGVQILGTLITEHDEGVQIWNKIFESKAACDNCIDALVAISVKANLDGWLLNVENKIPQERIPWLVRFVRRLTNKLHTAIPNSVVIWYDSVIDTGELKWQNELNSKNRIFFDVCDGIFTNYCWNSEHLKNSLENAGDRALDVYMGIDVFGRNTSYEPGPDCAKAMAAAREKMLSIAIFAIGWTFETIPEEPKSTFVERYRLNDQKFWDAIWNHLYTRIVITNSSSN